MPFNDCGQLLGQSHTETDAEFANRVGRIEQLQAPPWFPWDAAAAAKLVAARYRAAQGLPSPEELAEQRGALAERERIRLELVRYLDVAYCGSNFADDFDRGFNRAVEHLREFARRLEVADVG